MKIWYNALSWFSTTKLWRWIARNLMANVNLRLWGYPKFDMDGYYQIEKILLDNPDKMYCFVGADTKSLSWQVDHLVTRCQWGHAGFVGLDGRGVPTIYHMRGNGLNVNSLLDYLREVDYIGICEMEFASEEAKAKAEDRFMKLVKAGPRLDYDFTLSLDDPEALAESISATPDFDMSLKLYCSEFAYIVGVGLVSNPKFQPSYVQGRWAFEPDDLYHGTKPVF